LKSEKKQKITLTVKSPFEGLFFPLLQSGVRVEVNTGCSIRDLLCRQIGIPPECVDERIQTIFLNGKPVDRPEEATVGRDAVIALSAALPGLLGATLRKSGFYASLRQGITHEETRVESPASRGFVTLKVFNVLLKELAPAILRKGVHVESGRLGELFKGVGSNRLAQVIDAQVDGEKIRAEGLHKASLYRGDSVELVVEIV